LRGTLASLSQTGNIAHGVRCHFNFESLKSLSSAPKITALLKTPIVVDWVGRCRFPISVSGHLTLPARTIALLYKDRWRVELFFQWIKQHLRIKHFYGVSDNAVKTQIWISICVYALVAIVKKQVRSERSLYNILQILSVNAFQQEPLLQVLSNSEPQMPDGNPHNQLVFNY
jgi:transposase